MLGACARATSEPAKSEAGSEAGTKTSAADLVVDAGADGPRPRGELVKIAAVNQVSVSSIPAWPETQGAGARRLGYLRHGTLVDAYESALINDECKEGWFELANEAGWVCSKYATVDLQSPRVRLAPLYDIASILPYEGFDTHKVKFAMKIGGVQTKNYSRNCKSNRC